MPPLATVVGLLSHDLLGAERPPDTPVLTGFHSSLVLRRVTAGLGQSQQIVIAHSKAAGHRRWHVAPVSPQCEHSGFARSFLSSLCLGESDRLPSAGSLPACGRGCSGCSGPPVSRAGTSDSGCGAPALESEGLAASGLCSPPAADRAPGSGPPFDLRPTRAQARHSGTSDQPTLFGIRSASGGPDWPRGRGLTCICLGPVDMRPLCQHPPTPTPCPWEPPLITHRDPSPTHQDLTDSPARMKATSMPCSRGLKTDPRS